MPENIISPPQLTDGQGMVEGEDYEYAHGSRLQALKEQLAAQAHQYELEREHEAKYGLFGERNMAILNAALSSGKFVKNMRDEHIAGLKRSFGGESQAGVTWDDKDKLWRTAEGHVATYINKDKVQEISPFGKLANNLLGYHSGILELKDGQVQKIDKEDNKELDSNTEDVNTEGEEGEEVVSKLVSEQVNNSNNISVNELNTLDIANQIDPSNADVDSVKEFQRRVMGMKEGDAGFGVFGPKTTKAWQNVKGLYVDEELGDLKPDAAWEESSEENENNTSFDTSFSSNDYGNEVSEESSDYNDYGNEVSEDKNIIKGERTALEVGKNLVETKDADTENNETFTEMLDNSTEIVKEDAKNWVKPSGENKTQLELQEDELIKIPGEHVIGGKLYRE
tara:strand:- start:7169 stop:8353 length:1185 start_codon:yes stop_codon:yes gene_type:complete